eukprot:1157977-Pelagomonas_calceolata.AAC.2
MANAIHVPVQYQHYTEYYEHAFCAPNAMCLPSFRRHLCLLKDSFGYTDQPRQAKILTTACRALHQLRKYACIGTRLCRAAPHGVSSMNTGHGPFLDLGGVFSLPVFFFWPWSRCLHRGSSKGAGTTAAACPLCHAAPRLVQEPGVHCNACMHTWDSSRQCAAWVF